LRAVAIASGAALARAPERRGEGRRLPASFSIVTPAGANRGENSSKSRATRRKPESFNGSAASVR